MGASPSRPPSGRVRCGVGGTRSPDCGSAGLRLPVAHPVAAAAQRAHPGRGLRDHRRDRVRPRSSCRLGLACLRRPGPAAHGAPLLAGLRRRRRGLPRLCGRARSLLAGRGPAGWACRRTAWRRSWSLRWSPSSSSSRWSPSAACCAALPVGGHPARAVDRTTGRPRGRLGAVVGGTVLLVNGVLLDGLVTAADDAFSVRNDTTEPGVVQPTLPYAPAVPSRWCLGLARPGGALLHRLGPTRGADRGLRRPARMPIRAYAGLSSAATAEQRASWPSTISRGRAGSIAGPSWSPRPPARGGSTRPRSTRSST